MEISNGFVRLLQNRWLSLKSITSITVYKDVGFLNRDSAPYSLVAEINDSRGTVKLIGEFDTYEEGVQAMDALMKNEVKDGS